MSGDENPGLTAAREERRRMADELRGAGFREVNGAWVDRNGCEHWGVVNAYSALCAVRAETSDDTNIAALPPGALAQFDEDFVNWKLAPRADDFNGFGDFGRDSRPEPSVTYHELSEGELSAMRQGANIVRVGVGPQPFNASTFPAASRASFNDDHNLAMPAPALHQVEPTQDTRFSKAIADAVAKMLRENPPPPDELLPEGCTRWMPVLSLEDDGGQSGLAWLKWEAKR